jgi:hypothetical protein
MLDEVFLVYLPGDLILKLFLFGWLYIYDIMLVHLTVQIQIMTVQKLKINQMIIIYV